jgi:hypothetical protein
MAQTTDETTRVRKSMNELADTFERSGEKLTNQLNSAFLAWVQAGSEMLVSSVKLATDIAETGAERILSGLQCRPSESMTAEETSTPSGRMMKGQRDTLAEAVRIHTQALKSSVNIAQSAVDRLVDKTGSPTV